MNFIHCFPQILQNITAKCGRRRSFALAFSISTAQMQISRSTPSSSFTDNVLHIVVGQDFTCRGSSNLYGSGGTQDAIPHPNEKIRATGYVFQVYGTSLHRKHLNVFQLGRKVLFSEAVECVLVQLAHLFQIYFVLQALLYAGFLSLLWRATS